MVFFLKWLLLVLVVQNGDCLHHKTRIRDQNLTASNRAPKHLTTPTPQRPQPCSYNYLSPRNAEEGRALLDSITWPDTPPLSTPFSLNLTTCAAKSSFTIMPRSEGWRVGDELTVRVQLRDFNGNPKRSGGDFLCGRLHNRALGAGVVGQVQDHLNGTFTVVFPLLWNGTADVMLVQTSESITVLKRLTEEQPGRISFTSAFRLGDVTKPSTCNVCLSPNKAPLCNYTDLNTGEQWFCYKPSKLDCDTRVSHTFGGFSQRISKEEETLFQKGINMEVPIMAVENPSTKTFKPGPSGYYFGHQWRPIGSPTVQQFNNASVITACLKGKKLHLLGDSTIRQYYQHITKTLPSKTFFLSHSVIFGPLLAVDHTNGIMVTYRCHGPPIRFRAHVSQLRYVANELDGVSGGPNTVVVIGVWSHFSSFPMEVYYQRLMTIRRAVQRLKNRAPETTVIIRTANMKAMTLYESLTNSDWYSLQRDKVLRAVFKDLGVLLLEAWEMGQAHYLPHSLHPQPQIIKVMIDTVLSYTCPKNRG
uniref:Neurexophilin and PC-esterase domain family, member 3 n=1 Tax=Neogobius melanostomus TaxID=47308 RepID=A0A8C6SAU3_9GOBI